MAVNLSMLAGAGAQFFDNNGVILSGGLIYTYAAGTTTPQTTYTTNSGSIAHTNPIVLDSAGRVPSGGEIWLTDAVSYKFVTRTSTAVLIATYDNITGNASGIYATLASSTGSSLIGYTPAGTGAVTTTVQAKLRQTVSVKDFGATGDGTTNDTAAIQLAIDSGFKNILFPSGSYLVNATSGGSNGGACFVLTAGNSDIQFIGQNATILPASNKLQIFCINGAANVSFDGFIFDNSANGLLQNEIKVSTTGFPNGGITGNGNGANAAIPLFAGAGLTVKNCEFLSFQLAIYYIYDYTNIALLGGHLYSFNNVFRGCVQGHLVDTPESYEIDSCRSYDNEDSVNSDASIDPGHLLYVTDRPAAVPENGVVSNIFDTNAKSSAIKIRKGKNVAVSNFVSYQSSRGLEIWNVQEGTVTNCAITLATVGITTNNSAVQITDCGGLRLSNVFVDIRAVDAWGFRILQDENIASYQNKNWSIADVTVLADYTTYTGKAAINVTDQTQYLIDNARWVVEGAIPNTRRFVNVSASTYGVIRNLSATFVNTASSVGYLTLDATSNYNTAQLNTYDMPVFSAATVFADTGTGNVISKYTLGAGTVSAPSLSFIAELDTGIYRVSSGVLGVAVGGAAIVGVTATDFRPLVDNTKSLGTASFRWTTVYATTGAINTSDARTKQDIAPLDEAEKRVAIAIKGLIKKFRFKDAVATKGDEARIHVGVIAQEVVQAFKNEGLDANRYGILCHDELENGDRYGIRYEELLAFIIAAL
jgi:hypothetical protein